MKFLFLLILFLSTAAFPQGGNLKGKITDGKSPVPAVNILVVGTTTGTISDENGNYELRSISAGEVEIRFSSVGYKAQTKKVNILPGKTIELNIELIETAIEFSEVEVRGSRKQEARDTRTSLIDLNPRSAKILPGAAEDVLRTLQSLPGVLAPNDFSSQLIIRGSGPDQNLIIMDDVEIFNPYRLYGVISMFNPDAVAEVNLITGGFPAKYGDRLSAVLDVTNREGTRKKNFAGNINASIVDANLVLEGKNPFGIEGSWLINSRRTYYDLIVEPFVKNAGLVEENVSFPNFHDIQAKIVFGPFNGHKILLNGVYSRDGVDVVSSKERKSADSIDVFNLTKNDAAGIAWHYAPSTKFLNKVIASWYRNSGSTAFDSKILDPSLNRNDFEDILPDTISPYLLGFKFDSDFSFRKYSIDDKLTYIWGEHIFEAGAGADFMQTNLKFIFDLDPELEALFASNPQFRPSLSDLDEVKEYNRYRFYIQNNFKVTEDLFIQPSLRFDYYDILNKAAFAPRISLSYSIDDLTTLRAIWGIYYQSPGYEKLIDRAAILNFDDTFTNNLLPEKAVHYVIGIERWLNNEWSIRAESYYKDFTDLIIPGQVKGSRYFTEAVPGKDIRYSSGWTRPISLIDDSLTQIPVNNSYGEAYGLEFFLSKKNIMNDSKLSGWISYALSFADRFDNGIKRPFVFDQRNTVNIVLNYEINHWLDAGVRWQYGSGFPINVPVGIKPRILLRDYDLDGKAETPEIAVRENTGEVIFDIDYGETRLTSRKPAYHRLDFRLTALADFWDLDWTFYLDIINVYNRSNIIAYDYYVTDDLSLGKESNSMFPILPTLGFSVKF